MRPESVHSRHTNPAPTRLATSVASGVLLALSAGCASRTGSSIDARGLGHASEPRARNSATDASATSAAVTADGDAAEPRCESDTECVLFVSRTCEMTAVHASRVDRAPYAGQRCQDLGLRCPCAIPAFRPRCVARRCERDRSFR